MDAEEFYSKLSPRAIHLHDRLLKINIRLLNFAVFSFISSVVLYFLESKALAAKALWLAFFLYSLTYWGYIIRALAVGAWWVGDKSEFVNSKTKPFFYWSSIIYNTMVVSLMTAILLYILDVEFLK